MAEPTTYIVGYDFTVVPAGTNLNIELAGIETAFASVIDALQDIRRADGRLQNGIVHIDALSAATRTALGVSTNQVALGEALEEAEDAASAAAASAAAASASAVTAAASQAAAAASAGTAQAARTGAENARAVAENARAVAESARDAALAAEASAAADAAVLSAATAAFLAHRNSVDQTGIVTDTATKVLATTEVFDQGGWYDAAQARWTPPAGRYRVEGTALFSAAVVDGEQFRAMVYRNGVLLQQAIVTPSGTAGASVSVSAVVVADGDDYFEFWVQGAGAGDKTVSGSSINTWFSGSPL